MPASRRLDRIRDPWGTRTPYRPGEPWPVRVDEHLAPGVDGSEVTWVRSASILHSNGDALDIAVHDGRIVGVRGRAVDRVNRGRLGPKDLFGWQANGSPDRLTQPLVRRGGRLVPASWEEAMGAVVARSRELLADQGPGSVGFYTSGQLFLEDYYTLAVLARAGIGTHHLDANTRLCTATAAQALRESFGCDGQPGSYGDVDHADAIALFGHNAAETQPVLWMRILDRRRGPDAPRLLAVDPRPTPVAREADVHLALRPGTNLALMNALLHEVLARGWVDEAYVRDHAVGFEELERVVAPCTPEWAARVCGLAAADVRAAAELVGTARALLCTVLQGFYQSHQATAAAVQVNNLAIVRGMLGRPGAGVLQMNGQPTAQNTRETGADGTLSGFRNHENPRHVEELARLWNVDVAQVPHDGPPTHVMQMLRLAEQGSLRLLWVSCTNPAVSLPELRRIRSILADERLFLVVQDIFPTETTALADVVLPAATWGEKTGTFTNADRTVHLSQRAVDPPGQARADLDIFLDYARRMGFRDRDGAPLITWRDPESAFEAWKDCSRGRPCDYTALSYEQLRHGSGVQWPCTEDRPRGTERLYADARFWTAPEACETYGHDLLTGTGVEEAEYRARDPGGRALLKAAEYAPPPELPDGERPLLLTSGRTLFHFHTRTKTGRAPQLQAAAPDVWVELAPADAAERGLAEGDLVEIVSPRGALHARVRLTGIREGVAFLPFHYGWWDRGAGTARAANEVTLTAWDPISKQPLLKTGTVRVTKVAAAADGATAPAPTNTASAPVTPLAWQTEGGPDAEAHETLDAGG